MVSNTNQLKMKTYDGKYYNTDTLDTKGIFRLIESIPSPKAEPFKMLAISKENALNYQYKDDNKSIENK